MRLFVCLSVEAKGVISAVCDILLMRIRIKHQIFFLVQREVGVNKLSFMTSMTVEVRPCAVCPFNSRTAAPFKKL